jgi:hypothetical protein
MFGRKIINRFKKRAGTKPLITYDVFSNNRNEAAFLVIAVATSLCSLPILYDFFN